MVSVISWGVIWKLKSCPHCGQDMFKDKDENQCLQCGYIETPNILTENFRSLPHLDRKIERI